MVNRYGRNNILQIINYAAIYRGNFIDSLTELGKVLAKQKRKMVYLFCNRAKNEDSIIWINEMIKEGKKVNFYTGNLIEDIKLTKEIIHKNRIDIIHVHFFTIKQLLLIKTAACGEDVKIILHFHNHPRKITSIIGSLCRKSIYRNCYLIGVSHSVAAELKECFPKNNVYEVENAIEFSRLDSYEDLQKKKYRIDENAFVCLMFGFDYYRKGVDVAIKAVSITRKTGLNIYLLISLSINYKEIKNMIREQFGVVPEWIVLVKARNDVASYYHLADVFLSPSREEGFCYSAVEASYCGCCVIASEIPAQRDLQLPECRWFESDNAEELSNRIQDVLIANPIISEEQIIKLKKKYNISKWAKAIVDIYDGTGIKHEEF